MQVSRIKFNTSILEPMKIVETVIDNYLYSYRNYYEIGETRLEVFKKNQGSGYGMYSLSQICMERSIPEEFKHIFSFLEKEYHKIDWESIITLAVLENKEIVVISYEELKNSIFYKKE